MLQEDGGKRADMIPVRTFLTKMRYVKCSDYAALIKFAVAFPISKLLKKKYKNIWLICEDGKCARDNGYVFYSFMRKMHPEQPVLYAIDKRAPDYKKVEKYGGIVQYGSLRHWICYLIASQNISSQKSGKPNAAVCYLLEISGCLKNSRVFLQHGITKDDSKWLYYPETLFSLFVCAAKPEYEYVRKTFQYPEGCVRYLGFPRFDALHDHHSDKHMILIMPTWRKWLNSSFRKLYRGNAGFERSEYFKRWNSLLNNRSLAEILEQKKVYAVFCLHRNAEEHIEKFGTISSRISIVNQDECDIQELLKSASFLITDYSSVFFDFVYMKKPVLFYQFDAETYRSEQLQKGYFDYDHNPFGEVCKSEEQVVNKLKAEMERGFDLNPCFLEAHREYFPLYDNCNNERIYQAVRKLDMEEQTK